MVLQPIVIASNIPSDVTQLRLRLTVILYDRRCYRVKECGTESSSGIVELYNLGNVIKLQIGVYYTPPPYII